MEKEPSPSPGCPAAHNDADGFQAAYPFPAFSLAMLPITEDQLCQAQQGGNRHTMTFSCQKRMSKRWMAKLETPN